MPPIPGATSRSNGSTSASPSATSIRRAAPNRIPTRSSGCSGSARRRRRRRGDLCANDSVVETDYWPLALYDTREGSSRDTDARGQHDADGQRRHALHRARRQQLPPLAAGTDWRIGRQRRERGRLRHLFLGPPHQSQSRRSGNRRIRLGGYRQSRGTSTGRRTACSTRART